MKGILPKKSVNKVGAKVSLGSGATIGGDTGRPSSSLYYCSKPKGGCRCGGCDKICGPSGGCPCADCVELVGLRVNSKGDLASPGSPVGDGGDTAMPSEALFYCSKWRMECRCGTCDGQCGPLSGCPCNSCVLLVAEFRVNGDGALARRGVGGTPEVRVGGDKLSPCCLYYCGKRKMECRCGGECGERCGPKGGCPCSACLALVGIHLPSKEERKAKEVEEEYCPTAPPSAPIPVQAGYSMPSTSFSSSAGATGGGSVSGEDAGLCVICLERRKEFILFPCAHYSYCGVCVNTLACCAICRSPIASKVKVFES